MPREQCYRCRRPAEYCLCPAEPPMKAAAKIVLLMHDKEWRKQKSNTGRLTCLNLAGSEMLHGLAFDGHPRVRELRADPGKLCMLLYPAPGALNLSEEGFPAELLGGRELVVFIVDATWSCSRAVLRASPGLLTLPLLMFTPREKSRWIIKRQPAEHFLSTIECAHELLLALERAGVGPYPDKERLLSAFMAMQGQQLERAGATPNPRYIGKEA